jgi:hypothetical protein
MRIAVVAALVVVVVGVTLALIGSGTDPLSEDEVHSALGQVGYPVRYLKTDYDGPGAVVAATVRQGHRHEQVLVASDVDLQAAEESVDWNQRPGSSIGIGEDAGENDLYVWVSDDLTPGAFWEIVDFLCKAWRDDDELCEGVKALRHAPGVGAVTAAQL